MAYTGAAPTLAELLGELGFQTELFTRNPILDGTIPGVTRGFQHRTRVLSEARRSLGARLLALNKRRLRRQVRETGTFHPGHGRRGFELEFAHCMLSADPGLLDRARERLARQRREKRPLFAFLNLFDVHAPYAPCADSIFQELRGPGDLIDNCAALAALAKTGRHQYLEPGFRMPERGRRVLRERYRRAVERMEANLERWLSELQDLGILEHTLVILTSDHGEAFGEHGLYSHDASVFDVNLRVPLWIHHPDLPAREVREAVSLRGLFALICQIARGAGWKGTLLDPDFLAEHPVVRAEHFSYPRGARLEPRYRRNQAMALCGGHELVLRGETAEFFRLDADPQEACPEAGALEDFEAAGPRESKAARRRAVAELREFRERFSPRVAGPTG